MGRIECEPRQSGPLDDPPERDAREGRDVSAAPDGAMIPREEQLLIGRRRCRSPSGDVQIGNVRPAGRLEGSSRLVERHGMPRRPDHTRQPGVVELVLASRPASEQRDVARNPEGANRIPYAKISHAQERDLGGPVVPAPFALAPARGDTGAHRIRAELVAFVAPGCQIGAPLRAIAPHGSRDEGQVVAADDAGAADEADEGACREGPAREAEDEDFVPRLVKEDELPIRVHDVLQKAPAERAAQKPVCKTRCPDHAYAGADAVQIDGNLRYALGVGWRKQLRQPYDVGWSAGVEPVPGSVTEYHDALHGAPGRSVIECRTASSWSCPVPPFELAQGPGRTAGTSEPSPGPRAAPSCHGASRAIKPDRHKGSWAGKALAPGGASGEGMSAQADNRALGSGPSQPSTMSQPVISGRVGMTSSGWNIAASIKP